MKVKEGLILRRVMERDVVVDVTGAFSGVIRLNATSAAIWQGVAAGKTEEQITAELTETFEVAPEQARQDVAQFCAKMTEQGFFVV